MGIVNFDKLSKTASDIIGLENIVLIEHSSSRSDDLTYFLNFCPCGQFRVGTGNDNKEFRLGVHNPGNIFDPKAILTVTSVILQYILY